MDSIQGRNEQASEYLGTQNPGIASWRRHHLAADRGEAACLAPDPDSELVWVTETNGPEVRP